MTQAQRDSTRKLRVLSYAQQLGNVSKVCRYFGVGRQSFYEWKKAYAAKGEAGLINSKPCPRNPALRTPPAIEEKGLHLRRTYHLGQTRISWYLERYHGIKISSSCVYLILVRRRMSRLPKNAKKRTLLTHRYEKQERGSGKTGQVHKWGNCSTMTSGGTSYEQETQKEPCTGLQGQGGSGGTEGRADDR